jgi:hypothetical protein
LNKTAELNWGNASTFPSTLLHISLKTLFLAKSCFWQFLQEIKLGKNTTPIFLCEGV